MCQSCLERFRAGEKLPVVKSPVRVVDLPLNATEDRLVGSMEKKDFSPEFWQKPTGESSILTR